MFSNQERHFYFHLSKTDAANTAGVLLLVKKALWPSELQQIKEAAAHLCQNGIYKGQHITEDLSSGFGESNHKWAKILRSNERRNYM